MNHFRPVLLVIVFVVPLLVSSGVAQVNGQPKDWSGWADVSRFTGYAEIEDIAWIRRDDGVNKEITNERSTATVRFELVREEATGNYSGGTDWNAVRVHVAGQMSNEVHYSSPNSRLDYTEEGSFAEELNDFEGMHLNLNHETGQWQIITPSHVTPYETHIHRTEWRYMEGVTSDETRTEWHYSGISGAVFDGQALKNIGTLTTRADYVNLEPDGGAGGSKNAHIILWPEWDDLILDVFMDGYEQWRPLASLEKPGEAGASLFVTATLRWTSESNLTELPKVDSFHFELTGTSREPGMCLNWPLGAKDNNPDIRLVIDPTSLGVIDEEGQILDVTNPGMDGKGRPYAAARIDSFDFGARSELRVICRLEDDREIVGKLNTGQNTYDFIMIPKILTGQWIADIWREKHNVAHLADNDDGEDVPLGSGAGRSDEFKGDGFTLYEEYRGFVEHAGPDGIRHIEGDPHKKDFFILNLIGPTARRGVDIFAAVTKLNVHQDITKADMSPTVRLMNGNHAAAPHVVDQHGVVMKTLTPAQLGHTGAQAFRLMSGVALRPRITEFIGILRKGHPLSDFIKPFNMPPQDVAIQFDTSIAHELLHAIGVAHHGIGDLNFKFKFVFDDDARAPQSRYQFRVDRGGRSYYVRVNDEQEHDIAENVAPAFEQMRRQYRARLGDPPPISEDEINDSMPGYNWNIGVEGGQSSGNEMCLMRYPFNDVYVSRSFPPNFYFIDSGTERSGAILCDSPEGTGSNVSGRLPQSRRGNAAEGRGDCAAQVCVNDIYPLRDWGRTKP